jgi:hypothetical protein
MTGKEKRRRQNTGRIRTSVSWQGVSPDADVDVGDR